MSRVIELVGRSMVNLDTQKLARDPLPSSLDMNIRSVEITNTEHPH